MSEQHKPAKQFNFNTLVSTIVLGAVTWVGVSINDLSKKQNALSEDLAVIKATNPWKADQLNRIETEQGRMRSQMSEMQVDLGRIKGGAK